MSNNKVINSWDWDIRVRERNLRNGVLTDKDIEKHRAGLPDQAENAEAIPLAQPALAGEPQPEPAARWVAPPPVSQPASAAPIAHEAPPAPQPPPAPAPVAAAAPAPVEAASAAEPEPIDDEEEEEIEAEQAEAEAPAAEPVEPEANGASAPAEQEAEEAAADEPADSPDEAP